MTGREMCVQLGILLYAIVCLCGVGFLTLQTSAYMAYHDYDMVVSTRILALPTAQPSWSFANDRYVLTVQNALTGEDDYVRAAGAAVPSTHALPMTYRVSDGGVCASCPDGFVDLARVPTAAHLAASGTIVLLAMCGLVALFVLYVRPLDRALYEPVAGTESSRPKLD